MLNTNFINYFSMLTNNTCIEIINAAMDTIQEITRLAGKAASVTPAVCARCWTEQTHSAAPVLVGALGAAPATLVSETVKKKLKSNAVQSLMNNPFNSGEGLVFCMCESHKCLLTPKQSDRTKLFDISKQI